MNNKKEVMAMMTNKIDDNLNIQTSSYTYDSNSQKALSCWDYYHREYYPYVVKESYPVYIQERAKDAGKQAFEIIKALQDKELLRLERVSDFIEAMDTLIKIL